MKRFIVEMPDGMTIDDLNLALYEGYQEDEPYGDVIVIKETWETSDGKPRMTTKQRDALWDLCGRYNVPFNESDYHVYPMDAVMTKGYAEGWVGGRDYSYISSDRKEPGKRTTIYVGVSPEGEINS